MSNDLKTAEEAWAIIVEQAQEKALNSTRVVHSMEIGQVVRQGDIYIHCVAENHLRGKLVQSRQLAIGNTQGSRHMVADEIEVYEGTTLPPGCGANTFLGPCFVVRRRLDDTVTHPEHAWASLPERTYQVTHQMDARTGKRVKD